VEFSFDTERTSGASSKSTIGSDRLRKAIERNRSKQAKRGGRPPAAPSSSTRRSVASADNVEFTTALRKSTHRAPAPVSYQGAKTPTVVGRGSSKVAKRTTSRRASSTKKKFLKQTNDYLFKGIWVFCALLLVRLVFSDGGVKDYYAKKDVLTSRFDEAARIEKENKALVKEIELLKNDVQHQKKVVRDHLGYIAKDEYLVLFSQNR